LIVPYECRDFQRENPADSSKRGVILHKSIKSAAAVSDLPELPQNAQ